MITKSMWKTYCEGEAEFTANSLITGNLLVVITPLTLVLDLFFIVPELILFRKGKNERTREHKRSGRAAK